MPYHHFFCKNNQFQCKCSDAPANAKEQNQSLTILRGVCAFLNTRVGGTLYLGVDDLGYIKGIQNDIKTMEKKATGRRQMGERDLP